MYNTGSCTCTTNKLQEFSTSLDTFFQNPCQVSIEAFTYFRSDAADKF